ncbi:MAG: autotransporter-associated beta strand repeat-containing protein [Rhabdochlamydiaceae bacterium]
MRTSVGLILLVAPLPAFAAFPTPNTVLNGSYTLDGAGAIIDATTLPSLTGYFLQSGTLDMSNVTFQNFMTVGGSGSGGGAGFGGTLFINQGGVVTLNNVNFYGSNVLGGAGGIGDTGGILNNLLIPVSDGTTGDNGSDAFAAGAFTNFGNGSGGNNGFIGGDAVNGIGGAGGMGGEGGIGLPVNSLLAAALAQLAITTANIVTDTAFVTASGIELGAIEAAIVFAESFNANPFLLGYPLAEGIVDEAMVAAIETIVTYLSTNLVLGDALSLAWQTALVTAQQITAYEVSGTAGKGGNGGNGGAAGDGSFGFGGGRGGDGGMGGDATPASVSPGGLGGNSGKGGDGGFGGGGGRSGIPGLSGANGTFASVSNGASMGLNGIGGAGGFGGGDGSNGALVPDGTGGNGGSGFGGAIFLSIGSTLNITGPAIFCGNVAQAGSSLNNGISGDSAGADLFMMTGSSLTLDPGLGNTIHFGGTIADDSTTSVKNSPYGDGAGAGLTVNSGLVIFDGENTYSGQTLISGGVLQAEDGVGVNFSSNINLAGGIFQGQGTLERFLGTGSGRIQFAGGGVSSGFSSAEGDFTVTLNCGQTLIWNTTPFFLTNGANLLFGSTSATNSVTFTNPIDLGGVNRTILATANAGNTNQAILSGILSDGSLTVGDPSHTGIVVLGGANTYLGPTEVSGGSLILTGSLASTTVTVDSGATFEDVNAGLLNTTALTVNGTFNLDANDAIATLAGTGTINLDGGTLTLNSGTFSGSIAGTSVTSGITKVTGGTLTLSGTNTYVGPTLVDGGTLSLTGTLGSQLITISPGALFDDVSGGISNTAAVTDNGTLALGANQTIGGLFGSGSASLQFASLTVGSGNFSGVISGTNPAFGLTKNTTGTLILSGNNTYAGFTEVDAGSLILQGTLASPIVNIETGGILEDVNGGLINSTALTVNGLFILDANNAIDTLTGAGGINLNGGTLTVNSGTFSGPITGSNLSSGITKVSAGTLSLSGASTYIGPTQVDGGTLLLTGTLASQTIGIAAGATLQDQSGGLSNLAAVTNNGTLFLGADNTVATLVNSGEIDGIFTLTAATYLLQNGSNVNANLGTGVLTTTGTVNLSGTSAASIVDVSLGSTFNLLGSQRLSSGANVTIAGTLNVNGATQTINTLNGTGSLFANTFQVNNGGSYSGLINATNFIVGGGVLNFIGATVFSNFITVDTGAELNVSNGSIIQNGIDVTVQSNAFLNVATGSQLTTGGNLLLNNSGLVQLDATASIKATDIITGAGSTIIVPNSSTLTYMLLTGNGTINSQGNTFVNLATVSGNLTFLNNFTNQGILSPGTSPGLITIGGNYTEAGQLILEIDSTVPVIGFDQVRVGGVATLLPSSYFNVEMLSSALVPGNTFQVIANGGGGPIFVNGTLGNMTLTVNMLPANVDAILFDSATGQIIVTGLNPFPITPIPAGQNPFFNFGCTSNGNKVSKAIFGAALVGPNQINTTTIAGQLAREILQGNVCDNLAFFTPTYYGALADFAFAGDRALASQIWDRVSVFSSLPERCCPRVSLFGGYLQTDERKIHKANLVRQDFFGGIDYATCRGFSVGGAVSGPRGHIRSSMGRGHIDGIAGLVYLRKDLGAYFTVYGTVSGSSLEDHMHRPTLNGKVKSRTTTNAVTGNLSLLCEAWTYKRFSFSPRANIVYSQAHVNRFKEKGEIDALHGSDFNAKFFTGELGFSALYCGGDFAIEAIAGVEQPFMSLRDRMDVYIVASPNIAYSLSLPKSTKTRVNGGLNLGFTVGKITTLYAGYEVISGGDWDHLITAGIRICL